MVKSIHDLSQDEIDDVSEEIKDLLKEFKQRKDKNKAKNNDLNSDNFELSSWLTSTEEYKETEENLTQIHKILDLSQKQLNETNRELQNPVDENKSFGTASIVYSETYNIEDLIKNDETLKELKKLTSILQSDNNESASIENELAGSSASWTTLTPMKETEKASIASTIVREAKILDSDNYKTVKAYLRPKAAKEHTKIDEKIPNRKQVDLKFDSKSKKTRSLKQLSKQQVDYVTIKDGSTKTSCTSIRTKKKPPSKEVSSELTEKKKPYCEGSPEYIKGHYVPIISNKKKRQEIVIRRRASLANTGSARSSVTMMSKPEEILPIFPLKIDCISMFSEDEEVADEGLEEESISESGSGPGEPDVMLNQLWKDLLLPTDESDMDLEEFYKQFPKLKKKPEDKELMEENSEIFFDPFMSGNTVSSSSK